MNTVQVEAKTGKVRIPSALYMTQTCRLTGSVPTKPIFFSDLLEQGQIIFGNIVNKALENSTNLWKYDIWYTLILDWYKI